jgi:hypothetical protein
MTYDFSFLSGAKHHKNFLIPDSWHLIPDGRFVSLVTIPGRRFACSGYAGLKM